MKHILFTKELSPDQLQLFEKMNAEVKGIPFIKTVADPDYKTKLDMLFRGLFTSLVVTSPFAARLFAGYADMNNFFIDTIYTVGEKSATVLRGFCRQCVVSSKGNAEDLANSIVGGSATGNKVCFLSGEMRRDALPRILKESHLCFTEICVYKTLLTPPSALPYFDGIVFFSPSAVQSFYQKYKLSDEAVYAIGSTTQNELLRYNSTLKVGVAEKPSFESLVQLITFA